LGFDQGSLAELTRHVTLGFDEGKFGWPNVIKSSDVLISLMNVLPDSRRWIALGLALHRNHAAAFLEGNAPAQGEGAGGVYEMLAQRLPTPPGGVILGFEPLGFEHGAQPHSWLCNGLEQECFRSLGIRPNGSGFLGPDDADAAIAHISKDEVGAEPVEWLPWMLLDYT